MGKMKSNRLKQNRHQPHVAVAPVAADGVTLTSNGDVVMDGDALVAQMVGTNGGSVLDLVRFCYSRYVIFCS
jgi:hypothetical protein